MKPITCVYPALLQFFGANFHEDWELDYSTPEDVIAHFLTRATPDFLSKIRNELTQLLGLNLTELQLESALDSLGCNFVPTLIGYTHETWLRWLLEKLTSE